MSLEIEVVRAFIENPKGDVLWTIRREEDIGGGRLCLPGGKVNKDENLRIALNREISEETGYMPGTVVGPLFTDRSLPKPRNKYHNLYYAAVNYWGNMADGSENLIWLPYSERERNNFAFFHGLAWDIYEELKRKGEI